MSFVLKFLVFLHQGCGYLANFENFVAFRFFAAAIQTEERIALIGNKTRFLDTL
jgi:hypothetical protein